MRISRWCGSAAALFTATILIGCGGGDKGGTPPRGETANTANTGDDMGDGKLEPIEIKEVAVLKGRVTFDGTPPGDVGRDITGDEVFKNFAEKSPPDAAHCKADPTKHSTIDRTWTISKDGGVANVAVWVLPGKGKFFTLPATKTWPDVAFVDQPFCGFEPFVGIHFPGVTDADGKLVPSGQTMEIRNSSPLQHNSSYLGNARLNINKNPNIPPGGKLEVEWKPHTSDVVSLSCTRHPWMRGYVWSLPTPYYAVTDKDGNYEIKGVPAGAPVKLVFWHPKAEFFGPGAHKGVPVTLNAGDNTKDMKVKAK